MKVIIAGSRSYAKISEDIERILELSIQELQLDITEVVSGGAIGVDRIGESWARKHNVPIKLFLPDWDRNGRSAGYLRNVQMANYADALIAVWDGKSNGTKHMIDIATEKHLTVLTIMPESKEGEKGDIS